MKHVRMHANPETALPKLRIVADALAFLFACGAFLALIYVWPS